MYVIEFPSSFAEASANTLNKLIESNKKETIIIVSGAATNAQKHGVKIRQSIEGPVNSVTKGISNLLRGNKIEPCHCWSKRTGDFENLVLGSVTSRVVNHAHCSVLIVQ